MMDLWYSETHPGASRLSLPIKQTLYTHQSAFQKIDIVDTETYGRMLLLDGLVMTTERDEFIYHEMISHIPMLAHPNPTTVLIIGGGDGGTVREVLKHPGVTRVVLCEIDGDVIEACRNWLPAIAGELDHAKVEIQVADCVTYVAQHADVFDVILVDSTDPMGPGEGLFTVPFYNDVKTALKAGGVLAAQTESPWVNQREMQLVYGVLRAVFPRVDCYTAHIPTYPGAYWSWGIALKNGMSPLTQVNLPLSRTIAAGTRYYNEAIHTAAFALPNYVKAILSSEKSTHLIG